MKALLLTILLGLAIGIGTVFFIGNANKNNNTKVLSTSEQSINQIITPSINQTQFIPSSPAIESIFSEDHRWVASLPAEKLTTLIVTGDVMLGRSVNTRVLKNSFTWPFEKVKELLSGADVTFINLESPIVEDCKPTDEGMYFCAGPRSIEGLTYAGVDVATIANNHATNYREQGINDTVRLLSNNGIKVTGADNTPAIIDIRGKKIAFLGYNDVGHYDGINNADDADIFQDVKTAQINADVVIVEFHFGNEYQYEPTERQEALAHQAIDAGADLVVGNHPHWFQGIELYKDKLIAYSHGNLVFDQMWSEETKTGIVGKYTFYDNMLIDVEYVPIYIENFGQPKILRGGEKEKVISTLKEISNNYQ